MRFIAAPPYREGYPSRAQIVRGFTRGHCQTHDGSRLTALPCDLTAELLRKDIHQSAAEPGIGASRIGPLAVVCDRQAKFPRRIVTSRRPRSIKPARSSSRAAFVMVGL